MALKILDFRNTSTDKDYCYIDTRYSINSFPCFFIYTEIYYFIALLQESECMNQDILKSETEVYESQISALFHRYFSDRNIDLQKDKIRQTKFNAAWKYVFDNLFRPDETTIRYNNKNSKLDYGDLEQLNRICDIYLDICFEYNIIPSKFGFARLTGITEETMRTWANGDFRASDEKATLTHSALITKIDKCHKEYYRNNLADTPVGQITIANNDDEVGLKYAEKTAQAQAAAWAIPQLSRQEIAARYQQFKKLPEKPRFDE